MEAIVDVGERPSWVLPVSSIPWRALGSETSTSDAPPPGNGAGAGWVTWFRSALEYCHGLADSTGTDVTGVYSGCRADVLVSIPVNVVFLGACAFLLASRIWLAGREGEDESADRVTGGSRPQRRRERWRRRTTAALRVLAVLQFVAVTVASLGMEAGVLAYPPEVAARDSVPDPLAPVPAVVALALMLAWGLTALLVGGAVAVRDVWVAKCLGGVTRCFFVGSAAAGVLRGVTVVEALVGTLSELSRDAHRGHGESGEPSLIPLVKDFDLTGYVLIMLMTVNGMAMGALAMWTGTGSVSWNTLMLAKAPETLRRRGEESPFDSAGLWDRIFFNWMGPLMMTGSKRPLEDGDFASPSRGDGSEAVWAKFGPAWDAECQASRVRPRAKKPSVARALMRGFGPDFAWTVPLKFAYDILIFAGPVLLHRLVSLLESGSVKSSTLRDPGFRQGLLTVAALVAVNLAQTLLLHQYFFVTFRVGQRLRSSTVLLVYKKALRLTSGAVGGQSIGERVNLMSADAQRLQDLTTYLSMLWSGPLQIMIAIFMLQRLVGVACYAGLAIIVLALPLNAVVSRAVKRRQRTLMAVKDVRLSATSEVLSGIQLVKCAAWENAFIERVTRKRDAELKHLWKYWLLNQITSITWAAVPNLVSLATFGAFTVLLKQDLDAATVFASLALFNILRFPMTMFPNTINNLIEAGVSLRRVRDFCMSAEVSSANLVRSKDAPRMGDTAVALHNVYCAWEQPPEVDSASDEESRELTLSDAEELTAPLIVGGPEDYRPAAQCVLQGISLSVPKGSLICVVGSVGSGKTSLLRCMLREMWLESGAVSVNGSVAFCSQAAFIMNASVRDNVLFGRPFRRDRYIRCLHAACLAHDLDMLPHGDSTEIGEHGINLSGGQKARVAMARAFYRDADIVLLDDVLSAVDANVGSLLFRRALSSADDSLLREKTRVLVTHSLATVRSADSVVVLKDGRIAEQGGAEELLSRPDSALTSLMQTFVGEAVQEGLAVVGGTTGERLASEGDEEAILSKLILAEPTARQLPTAGRGATNGQIVQRERLARGSVSTQVYLDYVRASGGIPLMCLQLSLFTANQGFVIAGNWWLSRWSHEASSTRPEGMGALNLRNLEIYSALVMISLCFVCLRQLVTARAGVRAAKVLHARMLSAVIGSPMSFYHTTPLGRILNRFASDMYTIDEKLPGTLNSWIAQLFVVAGVILVCASVTPLFCLAIVPMAFVYRATQNYYIASSREVSRINSSSKSPLFSQFGETLSGVVTIRAYGDAARFEGVNQDLLDHNQSSYFVSTNINRWLAVRLECLATGIVGASSLFALLSAGTLSPSLAGLSISYALNITQSLNWCVRMAGQAETQIVSAERIAEYSKLPQEPLNQGGTAQPRRRLPPVGWPNKGEIVIRDLNLAYRTGQSPVLRGIRLHCEGGHRIGVCGRTGAGKSSLANALFRLADEISGSITLDGIAWDSVDLKILRSKLALVPQDPTLFSGTIRQNLDPLGSLAYEREGDAGGRRVGLVLGALTDDQLWAALRKVGMHGAVASTGLGLAAPVSEGGTNWSQGQRQLLCLARALLRRAKVVVLDEATASVDVETDKQIQRTIREAFREATVFTVAHRIHTLADSDRILVLSDGKVAEFDTPQNLLAHEGSLYKQLVDESLHAVRRAQHGGQM